MPSVYSAGHRQQSVFLLVILPISTRKIVPCPQGNFCSISLLSRHFVAVYAIAGPGCISAQKPRHPVLPRPPGILLPRLQRSLPLLPPRRVTHHLLDDHHPFFSRNFRNRLLLAGHICGHPQASECVRFSSEFTSSRSSPSCRFFFLGRGGSGTAMMAIRNAIHTVQLILKPTSVNP